MADVTQSDQCQAMADEVVSRYGSIDILSNNVGIGSTGTMLDAEESEWNRVLAVNLKSMLLTSKFVIPRMIETCTSGGSGGSPTGGRISPMPLLKLVLSA